MRSAGIALALASAAGLTGTRVLVIDGGSARDDLMLLGDPIVASPRAARAKPKPQPLFSGSIAQGKRTGGKHENKREIARNLRRAAAKAAQP